LVEVDTLSDALEEVFDHVRLDLGDDRLAQVNSHWHLVRFVLLDKSEGPSDESV
jgi:hypothetical protein